MANERLKVILGHLQCPSKDIVHAPTSFGPSSQSKQFEFTVDNPKLSYEQRKFYEDNGFLVVRNLVPHHYLDRWSDRFMELIEDSTEKTGMIIMKDISLKNRTDIPQERIVNKVSEFLDDDILSQHSKLPQILDYIECFTGPNIMAMHTMLINKPPDAGTGSSRHPVHQDLYYFPFRPPNLIVCAWTAMEKVTVNNGCLFVVPGSHKGKLEVHEYPNWENGVNKMYHGVREFDSYERVMLEMEKGDTVFFHPILLHGSGKNRTTGFRKAISCHYAASECYYIDVRGTLQESISKEIFDSLAVNNGIQDFEYKDLWKNKSLLVRGQKISL